MNVNLRIKFSCLILLLIFFNTKYSFSKNFVFECKITDEIENKKQTNSKKYTNKLIKIYFEKKKNWLNDLEKNKWLEKEFINEDHIKYNIHEDGTKINFNLKKYFSISQKNLELKIEIKLTKLDMFIEFIKYYYDFNGDLLLESEVRGYCS